MIVCVGQKKDDHKLEVENNLRGSKQAGNFLKFFHRSGRHNWFVCHHGYKADAVNAISQLQVPFTWAAESTFWAEPTVAWVFVAIVKLNLIIHISRPADMALDYFGKNFFPQLFLRVYRFEFMFLQAFYFCATLEFIYLALNLFKALLSVYFE
jgi:hypothetical protein